MKALTGYNEVSATNFNAAERLPADGYVLKVLNVKPEQYSWGEVLIISFDIVEGEYKGFFTKQYKAMDEKFKKWKGNFRLTIPSLKSNSDEDKEKYTKSLRFFKSQIEAFNKSNNINIDCSKEWNESVLKGCTVGGVFGNKEWEYDGKTGWYTECNHFTDAQSIRDGNFTIPQDKPLDSKANSNSIADIAGIGDTTTTEAPSNNTALGDLSDFEEILSDGDVPF